MLHSSPIVIHGVFLEIAEIGVLLTGESGIGKSELALGLIHQGHRLIADDSVHFTHVNNSLLGSCPSLLQDFLAIRNIGIINVRRMFGAAAICDQKILHLIIKLTASQPEDSSNDHRPQTINAMQSLANILVPEQTLVTMSNRNLVLLVETIVHHYQIKQTGYDANADLIARHQDLLNTQSVCD